MRVQLTNSSQGRALTQAYAMPANASANSSQYCHGLNHARIVNRPGANDSAFNIPAWRCFAIKVTGIGEPKYDQAKTAQTNNGIAKKATAFQGGGLRFTSSVCPARTSPI